MGGGGGGWEPGCRVAYLYVGQHIHVGRSLWPVWEAEKPASQYS